MYAWDTAVTFEQTDNDGSYSYGYHDVYYIVPIRTAETVINLSIYALSSYVRACSPPKAMLCKSNVFPSTIPTPLSKL
jgi:hypothetical protein